MTLIVPAVSILTMMMFVVCTRTRQIRAFVKEYEKRTLQRIADGDGLLV